MRLFQTLKISVSIFFCMLFVLGIAVFVYPLLQRVFRMPEQTSEEEKMPISAEPLPEPETVRVQAICVMNEEETEFTGLYVEILNSQAGKLFYFEIPVYTKITMSQELYRKLQVYSPELPQYLKLSKLPASFSAEYRGQGTIRILEEVLGIAIGHWSCVDEAAWQEWKEALFPKEEESRTFYECYRNFVAAAESDETPARRWIYYDTYRVLSAEWEGIVPGAEGIGEYEVYRPQTEEVLGNRISENAKGE